MVGEYFFFGFLWTLYFFWRFGSVVAILAIGACVFILFYAVKSLTFHLPNSLHVHVLISSFLRRICTYQSRKEDVQVEENEHYWFQCPRCGYTTSRPTLGTIPLCTRQEQHENFVLMLQTPAERMDFTTVQVKDLLERTDAVFETSEARIALLLEQTYGCTFGEQMPLYLERRRCYISGEHPEKTRLDRGVLCPIETAINLAIDEIDLEID